MGISLAVLTWLANDPMEFCNAWMRHYTMDHGIYGDDVYVIQTGVHAQLTECIYIFGANMVDQAIPSDVTMRHNGNFKDRTMQVWQNRLLENYTHVLLADIDELFLPNPHLFPGGILQYVSSLHESVSVVAALGLEILPHGPLIEWWNSSSIFESRRWVRRRCGMNKAVLTRAHIEYTFGTHDISRPVRYTACGSKDVNRVRDPRWFNVHIKCADPSLWTQSMMDSNRRRFERTNNASVYFQRRCLRGGPRHALSDYFTRTL